MSEWLELLKALFTTGEGWMLVCLVLACIGIFHGKGSRRHW